MKVNADWTAIKDQISAEIKDKAPLVAEAFAELKREAEERGEKNIQAMDLALVSVIWVNMIVNEIEYRMTEDEEV